jgi:hypothetical protein
MISQWATSWVVTHCLESCGNPSPIPIQQGLDWTILVLDSDGDSAGVARLSRTIRSLRFLRLLRLGRVVRLGLEDEAEDVGDQIPQQPSLGNPWRYLDLVM